MPEMLELLSNAGLDLNDCQLCLIPDGPLFELPLHAAFSSTSGKRLYEEFASVRFALSLRTLLLQHQLDQDGQSAESLQGVAFGSSACKSTDHIRLPHVQEECRRLAESATESWMVFSENTGQAASADNFMRFHQAGNVVWFSGHGGKVSSADESLPASGRFAMLFQDRPVLDRELLSQGASFRNQELVHLSCCMLGAISTTAEHSEIEGFIAMTTLLGSRRVTSAMWPLADHAAAVFGGLFAESLRNVLADKSTNATVSFASALKQATTRFRTVDSGRYDHECFWAPYTLYGLA